MYFTTKSRLLFILKNNEKYKSIFLAGYVMLVFNVCLLFFFHLLLVIFRSFRFLNNNFFTNATLEKKSINISICVTIKKNIAFYFIIIHLKLLKILFYLIILIEYNEFSLVIKKFYYLNLNKLTKLISGI